MQHLRHAIRISLKSPGFTFFIVLILALGIGANTAIFTLVNGALLRPLTYRDPSKLVLVNVISHAGQEAEGCLSYPHFAFLREHSRVFESFAGFTAETFSLTGRGEAIQLRAARISSNFFDVLGIQPALGRGFIAAEDQPGGNLVAVLSDWFWRQRFGGDPSVIGRPLILDSRAYSIVGVLPPSFQFGIIGSNIDLWTTHVDQLNIATSQQIQGGMCYLDAVARLGLGDSASRAQMQMDVVNSQFAREYPKLPDAQWVLQITSLRERLVGDLRPTFLMLSAAVALVLLIACANVASLLLTRALVRRKEVAVRTALGARRSDLIWQFLTESMLLAMIGGALGIALSTIGTSLLAKMATTISPLLNHVGDNIDWRVPGFALGLSLLTGVLFGIAPSLQFSRPKLTAILREEGRGSAVAATAALSGVCWLPHRFACL
jgi:putative ABC transport system permease protein